MNRSLVFEDIGVEERSEAASSAGRWLTRPERVTLFSPMDYDEPRDDNVVPDLIRSRWYRISKSELPERVFDELVKAASPRPNRKAIAGKTLDAFLLLWDEIRDEAAEPAVSVSAGGDFVAEWVDSPENSLVIMADAVGCVHFSLFVNNVPTEGFRPANQVGQIAAIIRAQDEMPLSWSDMEPV